MKELIKFLVTSIVDKPQQVVIQEMADPQIKMTNYILTVDPEDMGRIIGKKGKIISALRHLIRIASINSKQKFMLTLKEV